MASLRDRLLRLEQSTHRVQQNSEANAPSAGDDGAPSAYETDEGLEALGFQWSSLAQLGITGHGTEGVWRRTIRYDVLTRHGNQRFVDLSECPLETLFKASRIQWGDAEFTMDALPLGQLRFYDTETSGLGTGAGTFPFLHAVAYFEEDDIVLEQYFLRHHSEEGALLRAIWALHFAQPDIVVVSFNGKAYDWPLLTARLIMHRIETQTTRHHLDLLPISRKLWKRRLGKVKLSYVEAHILQLDRIDDLPGSEAPARYFAYVDSGNADGLAPVFAHNAADVCSLVVLAARIANVLSRKLDVETAAEYVALGQWHEEWGETDIARSCYQHANDLPDSDWRSLWIESMHHRKHGRDADAVQVWTEMVEQFSWTRLPLVELAKHAEHRLKDYDTALRFTEQALDRTVGVLRLTPSSDAMAEEIRALKHRLNRIQMKRERAAGVTPK